MHMTCSFYAHDIQLTVSVRIDAFDKDGDNEITAGELQQIMATVGDQVRTDMYKREGI